MTYRGVGVDYSLLDPHKREALEEARQTDAWVERHGMKVVPWTRGESVTLVETPWGYLGLVIEGLGTKSLVADGYTEALRIAQTVEETVKRSFYDNVAICNAAMAFNDLITLGVRPVMYGQYLAVANGEWLKGDQRRRDLIEGTRKACDLARCVWSGGETPALSGIIMPNTVDLAGGVMGIIPDKRQLIDPTNINHGDVMVFIESSGIHANGLSLARRIATKLSGGYLTKLPDGRTYGETLLDPTHIYVRLVEECLDAGVYIHYCVNVTGHGWRKLMRALQPFTYVVETLPTQLPIFDFIQKHGPVEDAEAYGNLNMGVGFGIYVAEKDADHVLSIATSLGHKGLVGGHIEKGDKKVVIKPKSIVFTGDTLAVR